MTKAAELYSEGLLIQQYRSSLAAVFDIALRIRSSKLAKKKRKRKRGTKKESAAFDEGERTILSGVDRT